MTGAKPARDFRALIVEDQAAIRYALSRYFARRKWAVDEVTNGRDALESLKRNPRSHYSLIVSDVKMPQLSGLELYALLSDEMPDLLDRFVFTTGDSSSEDVAEFLARTNCTIVPKPFELSLLDKIVERVEKAGE